MLQEVHMDFQYLSDKFSVGINLAALLFAYLLYWLSQHQRPSASHKDDEPTVPVNTWTLKKKLSLGIGSALLAILMILFNGTSILDISDESPQQTAFYDNYELLADGAFVKDKKTGLVWMRCSLGQTLDGNTCVGEAGLYSYMEATEQAPVGWRLPSARELATLIHCGKDSFTEQADPDGKGKINHNCGAQADSPSIQSAVFPQTKSAAYWTDTPNAELPLAYVWTVGFLLGDLYDEGSASNQFYVRYVLTDATGILTSSKPTTSGKVCGLNPEGDGFLAIRKNPDSNSEMLFKLQEGEAVEIYEEKDGWVYVKTKAGDKFGWSSKQWVRTNEASASPLAETVSSPLPQADHPSGARFVVKNETVKDIESGLIWQRCSVGQTWDGSACSGKALKLSFDEAQKHEQQGWRVPTINELKSLRDCTNGFEVYGEHTICKGDPKARAYHESFEMAGEGMYGSSTVTKPRGSMHWAVSFNESGSLIPVPNLMPNYIRLVKDGSGTPLTDNQSGNTSPPSKQDLTVQASPAKQRFVADNETVQDMQTGLVWQRCSLGQTWSGNTCQGQAKEFAFDDAQKQAGNGWRVPSIRELVSLRACTKGANNSTLRDLQDKGEHVAFECIDGSTMPTIDPIFKNTPLSRYWSASKYSDEPPFAWYAGFGVGEVNYQLPFGQRLVRLVRDGHSQPTLGATTQNNSLSWPHGLPVKMREQSGWNAEIDLVCLEDGKACATINYKTLNCGGDWIFKGQKGHLYEFDQKLQYGTCVKGCYVILDASKKTYTEHCPYGDVSKGGTLITERY
jgi:hypothetical protein